MNFFLGKGYLGLIQPWLTVRCDIPAVFADNPAVSFEKPTEISKNPAI
ncbi:hypothetical protein LCL96_02530 [Rossellomorea aquimaris]|nr:hypothetical protein [Rossellomorea aquimaris]MCA1057789.1 hypothetical protein [Rossellomorea aquimaris]